MGNNCRRRVLMRFSEICRIINRKMTVYLINVSCRMLIRCLINLVDCDLLFLILS